MSRMFSTNQRLYIKSITTSLHQTQFTILRSDPEKSERKKNQKMSIAIKTILHRGPNEETLPRKEIRRFEIEENVNGRYVTYRMSVRTPDEALE